MPRDDDKNNNSRGRRDRPSGGKGRSGAKRGPDKKFGKRERRQRRRRPSPLCRKFRRARSYAKKPYSGYGEASRRAIAMAAPRRDGKEVTPARRSATDFRPGGIVAARSAPAAAAATRAVRPRAFPTRNSASANPMRRAIVAATSGLTPRAGWFSQRRLPAPCRAFRAEPRDGDRPDALGRDRLPSDQPRTAARIARAVAASQDRRGAARGRRGRSRSRAVFASPGSRRARPSDSPNSNRSSGEIRPRFQPCGLTSHVSTSRARPAPRRGSSAVFPAARIARRRPSVSRASEVRSAQR